MCGRFTLRTPISDWCQQFFPDMAPEFITDDQPPRYNIAPTQMIDCVISPRGNPPMVSALRWGLLPPWAKDLSIGSRMINARSETLEKRSAFRDAFAYRRCLIAADGYFEWEKVDDGKQPYLIERIDGRGLAMAGLWDTNRTLSKDGEPIVSCTIITTEANRTTNRIHDRMPVFLESQDYDAWLDPNNWNTDQLKSLLMPRLDDQLKLTAVSRHVNNVRNEDAECVAPLDT